MKKTFEQRMEEGIAFEKKCFKLLQKFNDIEHSSDRVIWIKNVPIFGEIKSTLNLELKSKNNQFDILRNGYDVFILAKDRNGELLADWIYNIKYSDVLPGSSNGSENPYVMMKIKKTWEQFKKDLDDMKTSDGRDWRTACRTDYLREHSTGV